MYTDKKNILQLAALLEAYGITKVVLCPGSRNVPIAHTLSNHPAFACYAMTDERSAGYFALGLALNSGKPVAVCCTSGTALLNLHPAVAEAFYQKVPLIVISADRPAAWIDPKECLYCQNNETLHNLMIEIAQLSVSRVFLFKEQTYRGRCLVAYKDHVNDLNELSDEERNAFMSDVARVTRAMQKAFNPEKINYGAYSDKLSHLHFHLAPKYVDGPDYGGTFQMNPGKVYLTDPEYQELIEAVKRNL